MNKIVGIGACVADTLVILDKFPKEDAKKRAKYTLTAGGGPVATGLIAASKLGMNSQYIGALSNDSGGVFLLEDFKKYGVITENITIKNGYRSFTSIIWLSEESGSRTCVFDKGTLPEFVLNDKQKDEIKSADLLMLDGNNLSASIEAAKIAKTFKTTVLLDAGSIYNGIENLLDYVDILIPSEEFALGLTGADSTESAAKILFEKYLPSIVVITCGKNGGILFDGKSIVRYPAFNVIVKDSNGAGDVFHGAFGTGFLKGFSFFECCIFASAVSAIKCTGIGSRQSIPDLNTVLNFLKENNYEF